MTDSNNKGELGMQFCIFRVIGFVLFCFVFIGAIMAGGNIDPFIHLPSLVFPSALAFALLLANYGKDYFSFLGAVSMLFCCKPSAPNKKIAKIALVGRKYVIATGVIATIISLIQMLQHLSDPSRIGVGMAIGMLPIFYAIVIAEIFLAYIQNSFEDSEADIETDSSILKNLAMPVGMVGGILLLFFVMLLSFSDQPSEQEILQQQSELENIPMFNEKASAKPFK